MKKTEEIKKKCLPIHVTHCIEEDTGASPRVDHNTIHPDMPTLCVGVVVVDVPPPCCESMISSPHEEHLPTEMCKIRILLQFDIKLRGGFLPERAPWGHNGRGNVDVYRNVVENRNVHYPISLSVSHNKFTFQTLHLYLADWTDKREGLQVAQKNREVGLNSRLNTEALDNTVWVLLLWFTELKLTHNRICVGNSNDIIMANRQHLSLHLALQIGTFNLGSSNFDRGGSNNDILYRLMLLFRNLKRLRTLRTCNHIRTSQRTIKWEHIQVTNILWTIKKITPNLIWTKSNIIIK